LDAVGCSFFLLRRVCWPALEECYGLIQRYWANANSNTIWNNNMGSCSRS
jgi:hypothetical protein